MQIWFVWCGVWCDAGTRGANLVCVVCDLWVVCGGVVWCDEGTCGAHLVCVVWRGVVPGRPRAVQCRRRRACIYLVLVALQSYLPCGFKGFLDSAPHWL